MKNIKDIIRRRFCNIDFKKIILFKNPNECNDITLERINPNHVGTLWGRRKKKFNKGTNYIRIGKVYFKILPVVYGLSVVAWLDAFTGYVYNLLLDVSIYTFITVFTIAIIYYCFIFDRLLYGDAIVSYLSWDRNG